MFPTVTVLRTLLAAVLVRNGSRAKAESGRPRPARSAVSIARAGMQVFRQLSGGGSRRGWRLPAPSAWSHGILLFDEHRALPGP